MPQKQREQMKRSLIVAFQLSETPLESPFTSSFAPLPLKAAILSSHLPEISDQFSFTKFSLKESSSAKNRTQSVMPMIRTVSRYPTRYP